MPRRASPRPNSVIPCSAVDAASDSIMRAISASGGGAPGDVAT
jgi:hypothetical protein